MRLDLISALEGRISEPPPEEGPASGSGGGFPDVLRSTFDEIGASQQRVEADGEGTPEASEAVPEEAVESESGRDAGEDPGADGPRDPEEVPDPEVGKADSAAPDENALPEDGVDVAGLAAVASALLNEARSGQSVGSSTEGDGAISALDADADAGDRANPAGVPSEGEGLAGKAVQGGRLAPGQEPEAGAEADRARSGERADAREGEASRRRVAPEDRADRIGEAGEGRGRAGTSSVEGGERALADAPIRETVRRGSTGGEMPGARSEADGNSGGVPGVATGFAGDGEATSDDGSDSSSKDRAEIRAEARRAGEEARREQSNLDRVAEDGAAENVRLEGVRADLELEHARSAVSLRAPEVVPVEGAGNVANPVAGMVTEMTTTATPGSPTPAAASDAIAVQTEWLASRGGGSARLLLNPPDLGEIAIRVTLRDGAVDVVMVAHEAAARSVAEDQSDRLAHAFANRDLRMETFEVRRGDPGEPASLDLSQFGDSGPRGRDRAEDDPREHRSSSGRSTIGGGAARGAARSEQPEILSVAPESGVDLRI